MIHGTGEAKRDWLYVEDTCERIDRALHSNDEKVRGEVFNLGSGFDLDILTIANMVLEVLNKPPSLIQFMQDRPGQVQHHISSTTKADQVLCAPTGRAFNTGLEQTIRWYADNREWWTKLLSMRRVPIMTTSGSSAFY
jgi:dTDP-glucose 4,6-dehydratase